MSQPSRTVAIRGSSVSVHDKPEGGSIEAARRIVEVIRAGVKARRKAVIGLATGSTPEPIYAELVRMHRAGDFSFADVTTYNLDEYYPMSPLDPRSYRAYMQRHLFDHVDLGSNRAHVLDGTVPVAFAGDQAAAFDRWIDAEGGLDCQLLGIGRNGHIGFNEPAPDLTPERAMALPTRLVELHPTTVADAARDFGGEGSVPRRALTMGLAPILAARSILVVAFGVHKAEAVARSLRGPITASVPGSLLQTVGGRVHWVLDEPAASLLI